MSINSTIEAGAVARLHIRKEDDGIYASVQVLNGERLQIKDSPVDVYLAPPSAPAIEAAAYMRAAAAVACPGRTIFDTEKAIIALIPKDGRTQLEEFGMKVATETRAAVLINTREDLFTEDSSLRAIVTNLIGVPPLSSESVNGDNRE